MSIRPSLIFDLDGTLVDSISDIASAVNRTIDKFDVNPISPNEVGYLTSQGGLRAMISHAFEMSAHSLTDELLDKLFSICVDDYTENIAVETRLYSGVRSSLEHFKTQGWLLGICTNKPFDLAKDLMSKLDVEWMFSYIAGVDSFDFKKPDPRHLTRTIELCGGTSTRAIMVGDTFLDFKTA